MGRLTTRARRDDAAAAQPKPRLNTDAILDGDVENEDGVEKATDDDDACAQACGIQKTEGRSTHNGPNIQHAAQELYHAIL